MYRCQICGRVGVMLGHRCPETTLRNIEANRRQQKRRSEEENDEEPTFEDRLEDGFHGETGG